MMSPTAFFSVKASLSRRGILASCFALLLCQFATTFALAQVKSPQDAVAMVKKAAANIRKLGPDKALIEFNTANKQYLDGEVYLFVLQKDGVCLVNTAYPHLVGRNMLHVYDPDGVQPTVEILKVANSGSRQGWVSYRWPNPVNHKIVRKRSYVEKVGDLVVGAGVSADQMEQNALAK